MQTMGRDHPPPPSSDELEDAPPGRIHGATITSWNGPPQIDLAALFVNGASDVSIGGSARMQQRPADERPGAPRIVSLSDGTTITFSTTPEVTVVTTV